MASADEYQFFVAIPTFKWIEGAGRPASRAAWTYTCYTSEEAKQDASGEPKTAGPDGNQAQPNCGFKHWWTTDQREGMVRSVFSVYKVGTTGENCDAACKNAEDYEPQGESGEGEAPNAFMLSEPARSMHEQDMEEEEEADDQLAALEEDDEESSSDMPVGYDPRQAVRAKKNKKSKLPASHKKRVLKKKAH
jgi:hypothetical protein